MPGKSVLDIVVVVKNFYKNTGLMHLLCGMKKRILLANPKS